MALEIDSLDVHGEMGMAIFPVDFTNALLSLRWNLLCTSFGSLGMSKVVVLCSTALAS